MRLGRVGAAIVVIAAASAFAASGRWPWHRLPEPASPAVATRPVVTVP